MTLLDFLQQLETQAGSTQNAMGNLGEGSAKAGEKMAVSMEEAARASERAQAQMTSALRSSAGAAVSTMTAFNSYQNAQISLTAAQDRYNEAVQRYGSASDEAKRAHEAMVKAQNAEQSALLSTGMATINAISQLSNLVSSLQAARTAQLALTQAQQAGAATSAAASGASMAGLVPGIGIAVGVGALAYTLSSKYLFENKTSSDGLSENVSNLTAAINAHQPGTVNYYFSFGPVTASEAQLRALQEEVVRSVQSTVYKPMGGK